VATSQPNLRSSSQKPNHKAGCVNRPSDTFGICHSTQPGFGAVATAEQSTVASLADFQLAIERAAALLKGIAAYGENQRPVDALNQRQAAA
jgi:hypothetical protein